MHLLIGAGSFADAKPALRIAEALLGPEIGDISGILVEELHDVEALPPHARCVITPGGTVCVAPPPEKRRMHLESDARAFRDSLVRLAGGGAASWTFGREKGDPIGHLLSAQTEWNLLVIGHRTIGRSGGRVLTLTANDHTGRARSLSQNLSRMFQTAIVELDRGQRESDLLTTISTTCAAVLVIDATADPVRNKDQIRKLLEAARCPVVIVGVQEADERTG